MKRTGDLEDVVFAPNDALGQHESPLVRAHVLSSVPLLKLKRSPSMTESPTSDTQKKKKKATRNREESVVESEEDYQ